jgi:uncharacterized protein YkwD
VARTFVISSLVILTSGCLLGPSVDVEDGDDDAADAGADAGNGDEVPANEYCDDVADWNPAWSQAEARVRDLVNDVRSQGGSCGGQSFAPSLPLAMNPALRCAARVHSLDMATRSFFDHDNPDGESPFVRINAAGYVFFTAGENIAAGQTTAEEVVAGWLQSPGHCANILSPDFEEIGVGYVSSPTAAFPHYWTQTFGAR